MAVPAKTHAPAGLSTRSTVGLIIACVAGFVGLMLVPGLYLATQVSGSTAALRFVGEIRQHPAALLGGLESVRDRMNARGYLQPSLGQVREAARGIDAALDQMSHPKESGWFEAPEPGSAFADPALSARVRLLRDRWRHDRPSLEPLLAFNAIPYQDNESTGAQLNAAGRGLSRDVSDAMRLVRATVPLLDRSLGEMGELLQARNLAAASRLRLLMVAGLAIAALLGALLALSLTARRRQEALVLAARQQTQDILRTVKEGLFLLDEELVIGGAHSEALCEMFQRRDIAGNTFQQLLEGIVPERTLATALKFVKVLWSERTKENLVRSINPLGEVEVQLPAPGCSQETRFLEFDFHRVRGIDGRITHVLVSVSDISARVALSRELKAAQDKSQAQLDTLVSILHVDPAQLASFLDDSDASMKMVNMVLKEPAREEAAFRKKLDTIFRQVHSVKGEAAGLGLASIEDRAHSFEDDLRALREKPSLSGSEFLPLVLKLDDLFTHLQSIRDLVARLSRLRVSAEQPEEPALGEGTDVIEVGQGAQSLQGTIMQVAQRVAAEQGKEVHVECVGFGSLPPQYRRMVKDIAVQAVRNSLVHGIESRQFRLGSGKPAQGTIHIEVQNQGPTGFRITLEDDGQGLSTERIKEVAVQKGFITREQAEAMESRQVLGLLFRAGFTTVDTATRDAGRGVGMNVMADLVQQSGGKLGVATAPGRFTRFTIQLPPVGEAADATEVA